MSVTVIAIAVLKENNRIYVLASQRGTGTPDKELIGKWNLTCGYLDFDETGMEAAARETFEETGVDISNETTKLLFVNTDPNRDKRQNVSLRYGVRLKGKKEFYEKHFSREHNEKDEAGEIRFIDINDLDKYEWAFNHNEILRGMLDTILKLDE